MKKIFLFTLISIFSLNTFSQLNVYSTNRYASFLNLYNIDIGYSTPYEFEILIYAFSFDDDSSLQVGGFAFSSEQLPTFIYALKLAKQKYKKFVSQSSKDKRIVYFQRLDIFIDLFSFFLIGEDIVFNAESDYNFMYAEVDGNQVLLLSTGWIDTEYEQTQHKGFSLAFLSEKEIDVLINLLSEKKMKKFIKNKYRVLPPL